MPGIYGMACGNFGSEEYVSDALRCCSGCGKIVVECECDTLRSRLLYLESYHLQERERLFFDTCITRSGE